MILIAGLLVKSANCEAVTSMTADQPDVKLTNRQTATATVTPEVITRLKPNEENNTVLKFLRNILNAIIPNLKKGRTIMKKIPRIKAPPAMPESLTGRDYTDSDSAD